MRFIAKTTPQNLKIWLMKYSKFYRTELENFALIASYTGHLFLIVSYIWKIIIKNIITVSLKNNGKVHIITKPSVICLTNLSRVYWLSTNQRVEWSVPVYTR